MLNTVIQKLQKKKRNILIIIFFILLFSLFFQNISVSSLPKLSVENIDSENYFENYIAYDICEISSGNPWKKQWDIKTLPVFYNTNFKTIHKVRPSQLNTIPIKKDTAVSVSNTTNPIKIVFDTPISLPYISQEISTQEQTLNILSDFMDFYKKKLNWQEYELTVSSFYSDTGIKNFEFHAYKKGNSLEEQLLNYHFNTISFQLDTTKKITSILWTKENLSQKIGDYPIISSKKAEKLLFAKHYITTSPFSLKTTMPIVKVELTYLHNKNNRIFMPYYKFFVQLPAHKNNMNQYGTYYVPAIEQEYLNKFPISDMYFDKNHYF